VKENAELLSKVHFTEVFAQEIAKENGEKETLQTYQPGSLVYGRILLTYIAAR
jgi:hypothetical protein